MTNHNENPRMAVLEMIQAIRYAANGGLDHISDDTLESLCRAVAHGHHLGAGRESAQLLAGMGFGRTAIEHLTAESLRCYPAINIHLSEDRIVAKVMQLKAEEN